MEILKNIKRFIIFLLTALLYMVIGYWLLCVVLWLGDVYYRSQTMAYKDPPEKIEIDGVTYVTGFYDEEFFEKGSVKRKDREQCVLEENDYRWYEVDGTPFEIYGGTWIYGISEWYPTFYCREDQFDEVQAYYQDIENYDYYFCYLVISGWEAFPEEAVDNEKMEIVIEEHLLLEADIDPYEGKGYTEEVLYLGDLPHTDVYIRRESKDGLLCSKWASYAYVEGKLYARKPMWGWLGPRLVDGILEGKSVSSIVDQFNKDEVTYYLLDDEEHLYIAEMFEKYAYDKIVEEGGNVIHGGE
ncbi:MAG: hypothetical protein IJW96_02910 [Clostridia bacterium]|nr:hypothetical protein [Clostridia bacterium]